MRGGWPCAIDFRPEPNTRTWLEVAIDGRVRFSQLLDADGHSGRRLIRFVLPDNLSGAPRPAVYTIFSARVSRGWILTDAEGKNIRAAVEIYGVGAGPKAVGSVALDDVIFEPGSIHFQPKARSLASYSFNARSEFNRAVVEILRFEKRGGEISLEPVRSENLTNVKLGRSAARTWNGTKDGQLMPSVGVHNLQIRAWFNSEDRSWVGAWSPNPVVVSK